MLVELVEPITYKVGRYNVTAIYLLVTDALSGKAYSMALTIDGPLDKLYAAEGTYWICPDKRLAACLVAQAKREGVPVTMQQRYSDGKRW